MHREQTDQDVSQHENGNREAEHGEAHHEAVCPAACSCRGYDAQWDCDRHGHDERAKRQRDSRLDALPDQRRHRQIGEDRRAEIPVRKSPDPSAELHQKRLIQAQFGADVLDIGIGGDITGDHRCRVARRQKQQREHDQRDDRHDDECRAQPAQDVDDHGACPSGGFTSSRRSRETSPARRWLRTGSSDMPSR